MSDKELIEHFAIGSVPPAPISLFRPRYNIAPTQDIAVVRESTQRGGRELTAMHWGLIPSWAREPTAGNRMINARGETLAGKPSFRAAFKRRRCLIPASGFFEWKQQGKKRQPYYIHRFDRTPIAFAGLWENWRPDNSTDPEIDSCTIITTEANAMMREIHERMPVILAPSDYSIWLDPNIQDPRDVDHLLVPLSDDVLTAYAVSTYVNNPKHDDRLCIERLQELF